MDKEEKARRESYLKGIVNNLPESPGCYQYLNEGGTIIYVGKAKNLKRRVSSYFNKEQQTLKTRLLVAKIADIRYVVVIHQHLRKHWDLIFHNCFLQLNA